MNNQDRLAAALAVAAPEADPQVWVDPLQAAFARWGLDNPRRQAAALGQFAVEAGDGFGELEENLAYVTGSRLVSVFPEEFQPGGRNPRDFLKNPIKLANYVYSGKNGNGSEGSGDGWRYRGRGLIQISGKDEYSELADAFGQDLGDGLLAWVATPIGAALSGCWYLVWQDCLGLADGWFLRAISQRVNGSALQGLTQRIGASNRALKVLEND